MAQLVHIFGRRRAALAGEHGGRIARREMDQQEVEHDDAEDHRQRGDQPVSHIAGETHGYFSSQARSKACCVPSGPVV